MGWNPVKSVTNFVSNPAKTVNTAISTSRSGMNKAIDVNRKNFNKALPTLRQVGATAIGAGLGGVPGALIGAALSAPKKAGQAEGGGGAQAGSAGPAAPTGPQLSPWQGISSLGEKGVYTPQTISGEAIQKEMESSPWYSMAKQRQGLEEAQRLTGATQQAGTQAAQARGMLASRGGLRGGAAERLAGSAAENLAMMRQGIAGQGAEARADLGMKGLGLATDIAGRNVEAANRAREFNVGANIADLRAQNERNMQQYLEEMKLKGAEATSEAIRKSKGGGGFFQDPVGATRATFSKMGIG